jgi:hypothetical protein
VPGSATAAPTPTPSGPVPTPTNMAGVCVGTLNWDEVPSGSAVQYYCILRYGATYNFTPQHRIITIIADRTGN